MARGSSDWHNVLSTELRKPGSKKEAFKRASRIYHSKRIMSNPGPHKSNLIKLGLIAAAGFVGLKILGSSQAAAPAATMGGCSKCSGVTTGTSNGGCALKV